MVNTWGNFTPGAGSLESPHPRPAPFYCLHILGGGACELCKFQGHPELCESPSLLLPGGTVSAGRKLHPAVLPAGDILCLTVGLTDGLHACLPSLQLAGSPISEERAQERLQSSHENGPVLSQCTIWGEQSMVSLSLPSLPPFIPPFSLIPSFLDGFSWVDTQHLPGKTWIGGGGASLRGLAIQIGSRQLLH